MNPNKFVRSSDLPTSVAAAMRAAKASAASVSAVTAVMRDGVGRIDQEIWRVCRSNGYISSLDTIQHGRLPLSEAGVLVDSGQTRITEDGCLSVVWVWTAPADVEAKLYEMLLKKEWRRLPAGKESKRKEIELLRAAIVKLGGEFDFQTGTTAAAIFAEIDAVLGRTP